MRCERNRSEIRDVALGAAPSRRLDAHLASCPACRAVLAEERGRLAEIDDALGQALAVEPSPSLFPRVRATASRLLGEPRNRLGWLLPVAASLVALAVLVPLARRISPAPGRTPVAPPPPPTAAEPTVSDVEAPATAARAESREGSLGASASAWPTARRAAARVAMVRSEPEVIVPPGGEAALRRYVQAIRHSRVVDQVVLGPGPDPVDWTEPASMRQQPRAIDRFPGEMEPPTADAEALTPGD